MSNLRTISDFKGTLKGAAHAPIYLKFLFQTSQMQQKLVLVQDGQMTIN